MGGQNDNEWLYLYRCGSEEAFYCLFNEYYDYVCGWLKAFDTYDYVGLEYDDFIQVGMIAFWDALSTYRDDKGTTLYTYVKIVVIRRILNLIKRCQEIKLLSQLHFFSLNEKIQDDGLDYEEIIKDPTIRYHPSMRYEIKEKTKESLDKMGKRMSQTEKIVMTYLMKGYTPQEIAQIMHLSKKAVANATYRAHKKITH